MRYVTRLFRTFSANSAPIIRTVVSTFFCAALCSCSSNTSALSSMKSAVAIDQFPMAIGDSWTYAVYDSMNSTLDTVIVTIENPSSADRQFTGMWVFKGETYRDTMYARIQDNSVMLYETPVSSQPSVTLVFPLAEGASWGKKPDTTVVSSEVALDVPAGTFDDAFLVDRYAVSFNYRLYSKRWIVPDVGIVLWEKKEFNLGPAVNKRWVLINYRHIE